MMLKKLSDKTLPLNYIYQLRLHTCIPILYSPYT